MVRPFLRPVAVFTAVLAAGLAALLSPAVAPAQQSAAPVPLYPGAVPRTFDEQPLPPAASAPQPALPAAPAPEPTPPAAEPPAAAAPPVAAPTAAPPAAPAAALSPPAQRVFCDQSVTVQFADPDAVPRRYRRFIGMWSDAAWTPLLCAALVVENVAPDGTATIVYAFGPMNSGGTGGGVLNGTGSIRDGELRFENADGSQFAFHPLYADLQGRLTTPQGQSYDAIFKKTP
ncbi:MAG TPA: hypothetical protein VKQ73_00925 [Stellaceae bacterium]|nr:hypothetical protein [Stellaceae bacterium]